jgi:hypothetical protein
MTIETSEKVDGLAVHLPCPTWCVAEHDTAEHDDEREHQVQTWHLD